MLTWHVLDARSIWIKEFASAMDRVERTVAWVPRFSSVGLFSRKVEGRRLADPPLDMIEYPLQRGYARTPISWLVRLADRRLADMERCSTRSDSPVLVCTTPYYASVAEKCRYPVVYYQTDLTIAYAGVKPKQVRELDKRLCASAAAVCPNSQRIADYFVHESGCRPEKITIVPNAVRSSNLLPAALRRPASLPPDAADLPRPIAGVLGNMAGNLNWALLEKTIHRTPWLSWLFVGPTDMPISDPQENRIRDTLAGLTGRVRFLGARPYGDLRLYARGLDVAILPYRRKEPTYSGSSTRFYEHLAATRPILATRGFEELTRKEPLLRLADSPEEMIEALEDLRRVGFSDGLEQQRLQASWNETWDARAGAIRSALRRSHAS